jgi:NitT/TauT family transport system permease protein
MKQNLKKIALNIFYPLAAFALIVTIWAIAAAAAKKPIIFPEPKSVFTSFFQLLGGGGFWAAALNTLARSALSFVIAFVAALALAFLGALFNPVHKLFAPIVTVLRAAPTMAVILLSILWLDYDESPVLIGFLIAFPLLYSAAYGAVTSVDESLLEMANVFKVPVKDKIACIYFPSAAPAIMDAAASTLSLTVKVVIAAEVLAQTKVSIGLEMQRSNMLFDIPALLAWTVATIAFCFISEFLILVIKRLITSIRFKVYLEAENG